jgi:DNA-binding MarR family transcriptional regulator
MLHGMSLYDHLVLGAVAGAGGRAVPVGELTASLKESGSRMTYILKGLQAAGLIERDRRAGDRRTVEVTLTDAGRARLAEAERAAGTWLRPNASRQPTCRANGPSPIRPERSGSPVATRSLANSTASADGG